MKILHLTPNTNGYEEAVLLHSHISETIQMAQIEVNGEMFMTGGFLIIDNETNRKLLDVYPKEKQYSLMVSIRSKPYVK